MLCASALFVITYKAKNSCTFVANTARFRHSVTGSCERAQCLALLFYLFGTLWMTLNTTEVSPSNEIMRGRHLLMATNKNALENVLTDQNEDRPTANQMQRCVSSVREDVDQVL